MSCDNNIPLMTLANRVADILSASYVDHDDPRINNAILTAPSIRGEFLLDNAAKLIFCGYVKDCGIDIPFGKTWLDRPTAPDAVLVSYQDGADTKYKWSVGKEVIPGKMLVPVPPTPDSLMVSYTEAGETKLRWEPTATVVEGVIPPPEEVTDETLMTKGGVAQFTINNGVSTVADMLAVPAPFTGMEIKTKSYLADQSVGGNTYRYNADRISENDGGTILNGWEIIGKKEFYPEDFGALPSVVTADNDVALTNFMQSGKRLRLGMNTYRFTGLKVFTYTTAPLKLRGSGISLSVIDNVQIRVATSDNQVTDVRLNTNSNNYTVFITDGDNNIFKRVKAYHNYDGFCIYAPSKKVRNNRFIDCVSEKSGRIGFTADFGADNTYFDNCKAVDCKQGFHAEGAKDTYINNAITDGCGLTSSLTSGEQDGYAGPLRTYGVDGVYVNGFTNINPAGRCQWQHGGASIGSSDLVFENMRGLGGLILDAEAGITTNLTVDDADNFYIYGQLNAQTITGTLKLSNLFPSSAENVGVGETTFLNTCTHMYLTNVSISRANISSRVPNSILVLDNVKFSASYPCSIGADHIFIKNGFTLNQTAIGDGDWFQGFSINSNNPQTFVADVINWEGIIYGIQLNVSIGEGKQFKIGRIDHMNRIVAMSKDGILANTGLTTLSGAGISLGISKDLHMNDIPTVGTYRVGDKVTKYSITADTIYGWVCTTAGEGTAAVWQPLKYSV